MIRLRKAGEDELPLILSFYYSVRGQPGCTWDSDYPGEAELQTDYQAGCLYLLEDDKQPLGAVSVVPENELDDLPFWDEAPKPYREIARVVVPPALQGRGYGRQMLTLLFDCLARDGCCSIRLLVAQDNPAAQRLYRHLDFTFLGSCRRYDIDFFACEKRLNC